MQMLFDGWYGLFRILVVGVLGYAAFLVTTRIAGKRTLSKLSAFDFVITVAFGSTLSSIILDKSIPLAEGVMAFAVLAGLQFVVAWTGTRSPRVFDIVKAKPTLVFYRGEFQTEAMQRERLTEEEVLAAIRKEKLGSPTEVEAVVLENDGGLSVIDRGHPMDALRDIKVVS